MARRSRAFSDELEGKRISVWYDQGLIAGQPYRDVLRQRIETVKAVVVLWTENAIGSKWVTAEAALADRENKLIASAIQSSIRHASRCRSPQITTWWNSASCRSFWRPLR